MRNVAEKVHMVWLDIEFINFKFVTKANFMYEVFNVAPYAIEFHRVFGVFWLPHEMEAVLTDGMAEVF